MPSKYAVKDEQKLVCMLKLLHKINAVSAVLDCWSTGCSGDEASDYCKNYCASYQWFEKKREGGPVANIRFSVLLPVALQMERPGPPHRTLNFIRKIHVSSKKKNGAVETC